MMELKGNIPSNWSNAPIGRASNRVDDKGDHPSSLSTRGRQRQRERNLRSTMCNSDACHFILSCTYMTLRKCNLDDDEGDTFFLLASVLSNYISLFFLQAIKYYSVPCVFNEVVILVILWLYFFCETPTNYLLYNKTVNKWSFLGAEKLIIIIYLHVVGN